VREISNTSRNRSRFFGFRHCPIITSQNAGYFFGFRQRHAACPDGKQCRDEGERQAAPPPFGSLSVAADIAVRWAQFEKADFSSPAAGASRSRDP
jgi:hypothetical protein